MFNILIVEDNKNTARLMEVVLTQNGYSTLHASNGEEALQVLDENHIDLILVDIMMPVMDGITFTRVLRNSGSQIPIIQMQKPAGLIADGTAHLERSPFSAGGTS